MKYTTHTLIQGSPEWHAHRDGSYNASELTLAMRNVMNGRNRTGLIRKLATGIEPEITTFQQGLFDDGHRFEALARPLAEKVIGEDLFPTTVSIEVDGLKRRLSASLDGSTMEDAINFEHKTLNKTLAAALSAGVIPDEYHPQMEQGMAINGATRTLFMASKWEKAPGDAEEAGKIYGVATDENGNEARYSLIEEKHFWYESNPALRAKIIPTWRQIEEDAANYQHIEVIPAAVATPQIQLPAVAVHVQGGVSVIDNLAVFGDSLRGYIERINKQPATDQDFADLEATVKVLKNAEDALASATASALGQVASIDMMKRTADQLQELARANRLLIEKLVKAEKENRRNAIISDGRAALQAYIAEANKRIGKSYIPAIAEDFSGACRGLKSITSLQNAVNSELARCKLIVSEAAAKIQTNLNTLRDLAKDHAFLFSDAATIVQKAPEDLEALVKLRIAEHKAAEDKRLNDEREKIRKEEAEKLAREQAAAQPASPTMEAKAPIEAEKNATARAAMDAVAVAPAVASKTNFAAEYMRNNPPPSPNASTVDSDGPAVWRQVKAGVVALLDNLTVAELEMVADYINRKAWRKVA